MHIVVDKWNLCSFICLLNKCILSAYSLFFLRIHTHSLLLLHPLLFPPPLTTRTHTLPLPSFTLPSSPSHSHTPSPHARSPVSCNACDLRDPVVRCSRENLDMDQEPVYVPGEMNVRYALHCIVFCSILLYSVQFHILFQLN